MLRKLLPSLITIVGALLIIEFGPTSQWMKAQDYPVIDGHFVTTMNYFYDEKTDLCFASAFFPSRPYGYRGEGITNVPCTDKVMAVINGK